MRTQHINKGLATLALALAFISCSELKEVEFFTPEERAAIMARGKCESVPGSNAFCYDGLIHEKCNGVEYIPATHICQNGSARPAKCNNESYNPLEHKCEDGILKNRCGAGDEYYYISDKYNWYNPSIHFCFSDSIYSKCGGDDYDPSTHFCFSDSIYSKCGGDDYDPPTQFCYEYSNIGNFCGDNPQKYYDPDIYECKQSVNPNGIFLKNPVPYEGENYEAVLLGEQIWLARNLNYNVSGSLCYGDNTGYDSQGNCGKYGRLYNWAMVMKIDTKYNSQLWSGSDEKHQGICPSGWHIPSDAEWITLTLFAGGTGTLGQTGPTGTKLKAKSGWNAHATYGNGTDDYGFSALPGGYVNSVDNFNYVGSYGLWWSSSENSSGYAYNWGMGYNYKSVDNLNNYKGILLSVRCVKD